MTNRTHRTARTHLMPLAMLAALGLTTTSAPASAVTEHHSGPRHAAQLAKAQASPIASVVLGAPTRARYTVRAGDTLSGIAARNGVAVSALQSTNGISGSMIHPGQVLTLPAAGSTGSRSAGSSGGAYTVQSGDTLSGIASRHGVSLAALRQANAGMSDLLQIGQRVTLPSGAKASSSSTSSPASSASGGTYSVRSGDTLSGIAASRGVSLSALRQANPGISDVLQIGQRVTLPSGASAVASTFAGRTYASEVTNAASSNHATLAQRSVPSRASMQAMVAATARRYGVDPALAQAVAYQESGFNQRAVSPANAVGTMQVIPSSGVWASQLAGRQLDLLDPQDNVTAGVLILRANLRAAGSEEIAIAAYYQGLASVRSRGMFTDTQSYVKAVQAHKNRYR
ncbi:MAG: LysM peptidoglycan-binding domain-containing protein [Actinomycetales bacterium]